MSEDKRIRNDKGQYVRETDAEMNKLIFARLANKRSHKLLMQFAAIARQQEE